MGLFETYGRVKQWAKIGGNFNLIAQNFAAQYTVLRSSSYGATLPLDERLFAVAVINAADALRSGKIDMDEVDFAVARSFECHIKLPNYEITWSDEKDGSEISRLFNLLLQIEALVFSAYSKVEHKTIIQQLLSQANDIYHVFKTTLEQEKKSPIYSQVYPVVNSAINDYFFRRIVSSFSLELAAASRFDELEDEISNLKSSREDYDDLDEALHETCIPHPDFYDELIESLEELHSYAWKHIDIEESAFENSELWLREMDEINEQIRSVPVPDNNRNGRPILNISDLLYFARQYKLARYASTTPRSRTELNAWIADCRIPHPDISNCYIETIDDYISYAKSYNRVINKEKKP